MTHVAEARVEARQVDPDELSRVADVAASLAEGSPLAVLLQYVVGALGRGVDVSAFRLDGELSPNEAADLLHMSRPHLLKFLDGGDLAFHRVGSHRRIKMTDLSDFIARRERAKAAIADALGNDVRITQQAVSKSAKLSPGDLEALDEL